MYLFHFLYFMLQVQGEQGKRDGESTERPLCSQGWMVRRYFFFVNDGAPSTPADKEDTSVVLAVHVAISKQGR